MRRVYNRDKHYHPIVQILQITVTIIDFTHQYTVSTYKKVCTDFKITINSLVLIAELQK